MHTGNFLENLQKVQSGHVALPGVLRSTNADRHDLLYLSAAQARVAQIIANFALPFRLPQSSAAQSGTMDNKNFLVKTSVNCNVSYRQSVD